MRFVNCNLPEIRIGKGKVSAFVAISMLSVVVCSCVNRPQREFPLKGERDKSLAVVDLDTIRADVSDSSCRGNFLMSDTSVYFADASMSALYEYSPEGKFLGKRLGKGQGPEEISSMMYAAPLLNARDSIVIIDSSNGMYIYDVAQDHISCKGVIDFGWGKHEDDYSSPSAYNLMEMSDFGVSFMHRGGDDMVFPLSIVTRDNSKLNPQRYSEGRIFGLLDEETMEVSEVFGCYPESFTEQPKPAFEFFSFCGSPEGGYFVSFAADPRVYLFDSNGSPAYCFGEDPEGVRRIYTIGYDSPYETFKKDIGNNPGCNTGLYYDGKNDILFRTTMTDFESGKVFLQGYRGNNLVLEEEMPPYFKLLGQIGDTYIGVRFIPEDNGDDNMNFTIYRFRVC